MKPSVVYVGLLHILELLFRERYNLSVLKICSRPDETGISATKKEDNHAVTNSLHRAHHFSQFDTRSKRLRNAPSTVSRAHEDTTLTTTMSGQTAHF